MTQLVTFINVCVSVCAFYCPGKFFVVGVVWQLHSWMEPPKFRFGFCNAINPRSLFFIDAEEEAIWLEKSSSQLPGEVFPSVGWAWIYATFLATCYITYFLQLNILWHVLWLICFRLKSGTSRATARYLSLKSSAAHAKGLYGQTF